MWKKGESGNGGGSQKRRLITGHIERELVQAIDDGKTTKAHKIAAQVVDMAVAGNAWAIQFVTERTEGRPDQNVNIRKVAQELSDDELRAIAAGGGEGAAVPASGEEVPTQLH